ncbi:MAG: CgeB family protein [Pirellulales bacterium]
MLIVGNGDDVHVGRHLLVAAGGRRGSAAELVDVRDAFRGSSALQKLLWRWDRRPVNLRRFSQGVVEQCRRFEPSAVITTGVSPIDTTCLKALRELGAWVVNYSTDDPFNRAHRAGWFIESLPQHDVVFSPRRANLEELRRAGCRDVRYLPFAYAPDQHFREACEADSGSDVLFVGGADRERVPLLGSLIESGLDVALYGGYWNNYAVTRPAHRGHASFDQIRHATRAAKVCLILVRRANRDGHVMRSFEAAACGGCLLVEDTPEHRDVFADTVTYFSSKGEMVEQTRCLLADPNRRRQSAEASYRRIVVEGRNTYSDRLQTMLDAVTHA